MWVVKLGGSLYGSPELPSWLEALTASGGGRVVVVPGGGPFADQVRAAQRRWSFDDQTAHWMAISAMDQFGLMLCGLQPQLRAARERSGIQEVLAGGRVAVWLPSTLLAHDTTLVRDWSVSSDTLAAWLARECGARFLVLVKSVELNREVLTARHLSRQAVVDPVFADALVDGAFGVRVVGHRHYARLMSELRQGRPPGGCVVLH